MNIEEAIDLGRAWPDWTWAQGQIYIGVRKSDGFVSPSVGVVVGLPDSDWWANGPTNEMWEAIPDLRDPGTRGHALAQVEAAWGCELELVRVEVWDYPQGARVDAPGVMSVWWRVEPLGRPSECRFPTRAEALLAAQKAAPS